MVHCIVFQILKGAKTVDGRPGESLPALDFEAKKEELKERHPDHRITDKDVLSSALYPKVFDDFRDFRSKYGPVDTIDTPNFLVGPDIADEITVSNRPVLCMFCMLPFAIKSAGE